MGGGGSGTDGLQAASSPRLFVIAPLTLSGGRVQLRIRIVFSQYMKSKTKQPDFRLFFFFFQEEEQERITASVSHRLANRSYATFTALRHKNASPSLSSITGQIEETISCFGFVALTIPPTPPTPPHLTPTVMLLVSSLSQVLPCDDVMSQLLVVLLPRRTPPTHHMFSS